jgi:thiol-disulfide isomerase/thioredoxin
LAAAGMLLSLLRWPQLSRAARVLAPGQHAPDFTVDFLPDGRFTLSTAQHHLDQPVLLMFYDPDCPASQAALTRLNDLVAARPSVLVVAVNARPHTAQQLGDFYREMNAAMPAPRFVWGLEPEARIARAYHVPNLYPLWYFIRADGTIAAARVGEHTLYSLITRVDQYLPPTADYLLESGIK